MKKTIPRHRKMVLLALASLALLAPSVRAQTVSAQFGDVIVGFYASGNPGKTLSLAVDLGNSSNFYGATPGSTFTLPALAIQDLVDAYGANWYTRADLSWGAIGSDGRLTGTPDGHATKDTLWVTRPSLQAWVRNTSNAQSVPSSYIEGMYSSDPGSLGGANSTSNSAFAALIDASLAGSYAVQDGKLGGASTGFHYFNPTIDNTADIADNAQGQVALALYELQPGSGAGTYLGDLILTQTGMSFEAVPEPSSWVLIAVGFGMLLVLRRPRKAVRV